MSNSETKRCLVNFPAGVWSDDLPSFASHYEKTWLIEEHQKLKKEVSNMLKDAVDKPQKRIDLIDAIQRLGISYHFEEIIDVILHAVYLSCNVNDEDDYALYNCSLRFRLLRQHGYKISSEVFGKFKDEDGKWFRESLTSDVEGMLSLYEATHLMIPGEDMLEEALAFTTNNLQSMALNLSPPLSTQISHALSLPLRKNLTRLEAKHYMSVYELIPSHNTVLLTFAKLDYNLLQEQHKKELQDLFRWWKILDVSSKLSFARDRIAECYFWALGVYFEPQYSIGRQLLTKVIVFISLLDDIYDAYATLQELELLTEAIQRWDMSATKDLPEYMQVFYKLLLDVYKEFEENAIAEDKLFAMHHAKEAKKALAKAYLKEAKWFINMIIPTMEEFMEVGEITSAYPIVISAAFLGMGDIMTKETFDCAFSYPKMIKAPSLIYRFIDDIRSHEFEQERGFVATSVQCYMKQQGATKQEAEDYLNTQIDNAWKDMNQECLQQFQVPSSVLEKMINVVRVAMVAYNEGDGYTFPQVLLKGHMDSLLVDPVPMPEFELFSFNG